MTCIAAIVQDGEVYMAGDRGASEPHIILPLQNPKVWRKGEYLFGYYGTMHGEIVQNYFIPPKLPTTNIDKFMRSTFRQALKDFYAEWSISSSDAEDFGMLIGVKGNVYEHNMQDLSMTSFDGVNYISAGSGDAYAIGSLYSTKHYKDPKKRLRMALEAAVQFSPTCQAPIDVIS